MRIGIDLGGTKIEAIALDELICERFEIARRQDFYGQSHFCAFCSDRFGSVYSAISIE